MTIKQLVAAANQSQTVTINNHQRSVKCKSLENTTEMKVNCKIRRKSNTPTTETRIQKRRQFDLTRTETK